MGNTASDAPVGLQAGRNWRAGRIASSVGSARANEKSAGTQTKVGQSVAPRLSVVVRIGAGILVAGFDDRCGYKGVYKTLASSQFARDKGIMAYLGCGAGHRVAFRQRSAAAYSDSAHRL